jgi:hypothetical protein
MSDMPITITREDMLAGRVVVPGWYILLVTSVQQKEATTDQSQNTEIKFRIVSPGPFLDVPVKRVYNEKAPGFAASFIEAIQGRRIDPEKGGTFKMVASRDKKVWGYIKNSLWQNRLKNDVEDFRSYEEGQTQPKM